MSVTRRRQKITVRKSAATSDTDRQRAAKAAKSGKKFRGGFFPRRKKASEQPDIDQMDRRREGVFFDKKAKRLLLAYRRVFLSCFRSRRRSRRPRQDIIPRRARSQKKRARRVLGRLEKKKTRAFC